MITLIIVPIIIFAMLLMLGLDEEDTHYKDKPKKRNKYDYYDYDKYDDKY